MKHTGGALAVFLCSLALCFLFDPQHAGAEESCTASCHQPLTRFSHAHPALEAGCLSCHQQVTDKHPLPGAKSFTLPATGAELCEQCHEKKGTKKVVHYPVLEGECLSCHRPHGSDAPFLLKSRNGEGELCFGCHDTSLAKGKFIHGPVAAGACTECHSPHESDRQKLLRKAPRDLCLGCHTDMAEGLKEAKVVHTAVKEMDCTSCHNPHAAPQANLLQEQMPGLCLNCHTALGEKMQKVSTKHPPLYDGKSCGSCHGTHYSQEANLLFRSEKDLCLQCHGKDDRKRSKPLRNIARDIEGKKYHHGPVGDGDCSACHQPHGSDFTRMLNGRYPATFYSPFEEGIYDFCLQCHEKNLLKFSDTSIYTAFRNGKLNLHYTHVADSRKGRTCRACHEPHAAALPKLISEKGAPFGDWQIPIRFVKTDTGGSCSPGCHRPFQYDRETPVDYGKK